jgi:hypothetical protein
VKLVWAAVALVAAAVPACAPTVVATAGFGALQAGAESFINGELESAQFCPLESVRKACTDALAALQFEVVSERHDARSASINATELHGRSIRIKLSAKSPVVTKTNIRVGLMGDQVMSRLIMGEIQARCPATPAADSPEDSKP